jgi:hypothetical protein
LPAVPARLLIDAEGLIVDDPRQDRADARRKLEYLLALRRDARAPGANAAARRRWAKARAADMDEVLRHLGKLLGLDVGV